jgi:two-component system cell cycle sensor histidine kinase/response regulator CckA
VYLPKTDDVAHAAPELDAGGELPKGDECVLVVEDDEALRELTVDTLQGLGYRVLEAGDGEEAQRILSSDAGEIDLVMSDVGMPKLDGASLASWVATERPDVKVLLVSGYATDKRLGTADLVDYRFLPKPFTRRQLAVSVRKALEHS